MENHIKHVLYPNMKGLSKILINESNVLAFTTFFGRNRRLVSVASQSQSSN